MSDDDEKKTGLVPANVTADLTDAINKAVDAALQGVQDLGAG